MYRNFRQGWIRILSQISGLKTYLTHQNKYTQPNTIKFN